MTTFLKTVWPSHLTLLCQNIRAPFLKSGRVRFLPKKGLAVWKHVRYPQDVDVFIYVGLFMKRVNRTHAFLQGLSMCLLKSSGSAKTQNVNPKFHHSYNYKTKLFKFSHVDYLHFFKLYNIKLIISFEQVNFVWLIQSL